MNPVVLYLTKVLPDFFIVIFTALNQQPLINNEN